MPAKYQQSNGRRPNTTYTLKNVIRIVMRMKSAAHNAANVAVMMLYVTKTNSGHHIRSMQRIVQEVDSLAW